MARPSRGSDDHVKERSIQSPVGDVKIVSPISTQVLNALTLYKVHLIDSRSVAVLMEVISLTMQG